jgi:hypothetical protein
MEIHTLEGSKMDSCTVRAFIDGKMDCSMKVSSARIL